MLKVYDFCQQKKVKKIELDRFIKSYAMQYATKASSSTVLINVSQITMKTIEDIFSKIFRCLVNTSKPKNGYIELNKVELLWKKREYYNSTNHNDSIYILPNFMEATIETTNIDEK